MTYTNTYISDILLILQYIGCDGVVHAIHSTGDVVVRYKNGVILGIARGCLTKVSQLQSVPSWR